MRTRAVIAVVAIALSVAAATAPAAAQDDVSDQCRTIIGCADAGPKPEHSGDRGGYAQLLTLVVLVGGVSFIGWRVVRSARANLAETG